MDPSNDETYSDSYHPGFVSTRERQPGKDYRRNPVESTWGSWREWIEVNQPGQATGSYQGYDVDGGRGPVSDNSWSGLSKLPGQFVGALGDFWSGVGNIIGRGAKGAGAGLLPAVPTWAWLVVGGVVVLLIVKGK